MDPIAINISLRAHASFAALQAVASKYLVSSVTLYHTFPWITTYPPPHGVASETSTMATCKVPKQYLSQARLTLCPSTKRTKALHCNFHRCTLGSCGGQSSEKDASNPTLAPNAEVGPSRVKPLASSDHPVLRRTALSSKRANRNFAP